MMEKRRKIFVFGSNLAGIHGAGAAEYALRNHGAICGIGVGLQGDSYAIPTKGRRLDVILTKNQIEIYVREFIEFARNHPEMDFEVTRIGCGYARYDDCDIAPMFSGAPENVFLPLGWRAYHRNRQSTPYQLEERRTTNVQISSRYSSRP